MKWIIARKTKNGHINLIWNLWTSNDKKIEDKYKIIIEDKYNFIEDKSEIWYDSPRCIL